ANHTSETFFVCIYTTPTTITTLSLHDALPILTAHPRRYAIEQPSFLEDPQRVGVGGRIGGRRPGTHHGRRAADHIRENQTDEPRAARPTRESTTLQPREMLADGIDLGNRRAGAQ